MACEKQQYTGRDVVVEFSTTCGNSIPTDFRRLGALRGKSLSAEWDTTDVTADDSPGNNTEQLVTYINRNVDLDGISRRDEIKNQDFLEDYVNNVAGESNFQPDGWIRLTRPSSANGGTSKVYTFPVVFISFSIDAPYDGGVTYSCAVLGQGDLTVQYV